MGTLAVPLSVFTTQNHGFLRLVYMQRQQGGIMLANQRVCLRFAFSTNQNARNS